MTHTTEWVEGGAPGLSAARLNEPFHVRSAAFDSVNNRIDVTIGPGRANFLGTVVERLADSIHHIAAPVVNTTYHVYLLSNNTFTHNTAGGELVGAVRLGTVRTGAALADPMTRVDVRGQLPGAAARAHADATAPIHGSTAAATPNTMMQRDAAGRSQVADGVAAGDIATRRQVMLSAFVL